MSHRRSTRSINTMIMMSWTLFHVLSSHIDRTAIDSWLASSYPIVKRSSCFIVIFYCLNLQYLGYISWLLLSLLLLLICRGEVLIIFRVAQQPNSGQTASLLLRFLDYTQLDTHTHTHTHTHPVALLWTSDQLVAEAATYSTWGVQVLRYPNFFLGNGSR